MMIKQQLLRFGSVGLLNTAVDIGLYGLLRHTGASIVAANICSTSAGLALSLVLHGRYTFRQQRLTLRATFVYLATTLFGLWAVQPAVITVMASAIAGLHNMSTPFDLSDILNNAVIMTFIPKFAAITSTTIWNYIWYSRVVYRQPHPPVSASTPKQAALTED